MLIVDNSEANYTVEIYKLQIPGTGFVFIPIFQIFNKLTFNNSHRW